MGSKYQFLALNMDYDVLMTQAYMSLIRKRQHTFCQPHWMSLIPDVRKTALDILVDILLRIPERVEHREAVFSMPLGNERRIAREKLHSETVALLKALDSYSLAYSGASGIKRSSPAQDNTGDPLPQCLEALKEAAYLVITSLLDGEFASDSECYQHADGMMSHSAGVLEAVSLVDDCTEGHASRIFVTTVFPLEVVARWSPSVAHQIWARDYLNGFSDKSRMSSA